MKSLLQEASTIERAIDKAWNEAGKPSEFTVKVHDQGERNFLGMSRRPAIVSIIYKPERVTYQQASRKDDHSSHNDRNNDRGRSNSRGNVSRRYEGNDRRGGNSRSQSSSSPSEGWKQEWRDFVIGTVKQLAKLMNVTVPFTSKVTDDKVLTISFKEAVLGNEEEQRMLFASLSYLTIQFLKREYKSRFAGFRIVVTGPQPKGEKKKDDAPQEAAPQKRSSSFSPRSSSGRGGSRERSERSSSRRSSGRSAQPAGHSSEIVNEQLKFAQAQLNAEPEEASVQKEVPVQQKSAPIAQKEEKAAPKRAGEPLKKDSKHQPFFVLEDEDGQ